MSSENNSATASAAEGAAPPPPTKTEKQPSLYARKLLQKVSSLHSNASLESRQTIASWMVFNRKKCEGMAEGILIAIDNAAATDDNNGEEIAARLILLLRIIHQVLLSNCPTVTTNVENDIDKWEKSTQLRTRMGEMTLLPLWKALSASMNNIGDDKREQYVNEVKGILDDWSEHNVFGGPTVWEEYKKGWTRALKEAATTVTDGKGGTTESTPQVVDTSTKLDTEGESEDKKQTQLSDDTKESKLITGDSVDDEMKGVKDESDSAVKDESPPTAATTESTLVDDREGKINRAFARGDSMASVATVEVDFEGVEEAKVEPAKFLEACKVIASIQITRDLGSDAAMNVSSALSTIPSEVEEACNTILKQKESGQDETPITELLSEDSLSKLSDDVLDLDLKYARQSLQSYKEAIRQQRKARLQCLHLLLQSRCSFGSMDAARSFCGGEGSEVSLDAVLEKLKKRKETLVDAMALEGLDVEEDQEEKKLEAEEAQLKPLSWFPGQPGENNEEDGEPAAKKLKSG